VEEEMIPVKVERMFLSNMGFVVLLKGDDDPRSLPIFIGATEAHAIALWINDVEIPRPMTHDLLKNMLDCLECRVHRVEISELKEGTFYANIVIDVDGVETGVDARPSDAIALALRAGVSIYVSGSLMDEAGKVLDEKGDEQASDETDESRLEQLKAGLEQAISEERYEDAAEIRDSIRELEHHSSHN
jgi:bifunctional DNase/RNase